MSTSSAYDRIFAPNGRRTTVFDELRQHQRPAGRIPAFTEPRSSFRQQPYEMASESTKKPAKLETALSDSEVESLDDEKLAARVLRCKLAHDLYNVKRGHRTTRSVITKRFRALALRLHPDKNKCEQATLAFQHLETLNKEMLAYFVD